MGVFAAPGVPYCGPMPDLGRARLFTHVSSTRPSRALDPLEHHLGMSALFGQTQEASPNLSLDLKRPTWYQNGSKRVIPNHLVPKKKTGFQLSTTAATKKESGKSTLSAKSAGSDPADFSIVSFGSASPHNTIFKQADLSVLLTGDVNTAMNLRDNNDFPLYNDGDDLPPGRSLYDLNDEMITSLKKPAQHTGSFINKDPRNFANAFSNKKDTAIKTEDITQKSLLNYESAVLVFGYPEHMASQVIAFFLEFGRVLESFEALDPSKHNGERLLESLAPTGAFSQGDDTKPSGEETCSAPIFSGKSWVKITYDNPNSAFDALQESGVVFNGVLIGVVPYSKDAVEKLKQRKLSVLEDIGGGVPSKSAHEHHKPDKSATGESADLQATYIKRLEVKDGSEMFLKVNANGKDQDKATRHGRKLGVVGTLTNFFFGFHDL